MLHLNDFKEELNNKETRFTDEELKQIREVLYRLANIEFENFKQKNNAEKKGDNLSQGIN